MKVLIWIFQKHGLFEAVWGIIGLLIIVLFLKKLVFEVGNQFLLYICVEITALSNLVSNCEVNVVKRQGIAKKKKIDWGKYTVAVECDRKLGLAQSLSDFEGRLVFNAEACQVKCDPVQNKPWDTDELQDLRQRRKQCNDASGRAKFSTLITKYTRAALRKYKSQLAGKRLEEFMDIQQLSNLHMYPVKRKQQLQANLPDCAKLLEQVYTAESPAEYASTCCVPYFTFEEVRRAVQSMKNNAQTKKVWYLRCLCLAVIMY